MSKTGEIPYSWPKIEEQIEGAIMAQASVLEAIGPKCEGKLVKLYLGISDEVYSDIDFLTHTGIDITRHQLYDHIKTAYDYSYQLRTFDDLEPIHKIWYNVVKLQEGFIQTWMGEFGEPSPFHEWYDFPIRKMLDTFLARFSLFEHEESDLTIRDLSLLANMKVSAVRTSLSKEGFKLVKSIEIGKDGKDGKESTVFRLNSDDAKLWLSRRRGFIPQRTNTGEERVHQSIDQLLSDREIEFPQALVRMTAVRKTDVPNIAEKAGVDLEWLSSLINGQIVSADVEALCAIARVLDISTPEFAGAGVRYILKNGAS
ncbi:hypothetical protein [Falsihalocynthiibacter arcticus]|uniref:HTH cro/C1-type domain-containing protein n=1 Tax=Falsihalocynthiibacter arcticus TaxID=1579316 RepID=A0A126UYB0_9RHOB|nr:hypothetical protein [Falsihalocynthiibacter arcticus]AML51053.1 hypothetical protein RC74_06980 [Falsihalocynthiibacter arcticus]